MVAFNTAPHPDSQYDNIYGTLQEKREEKGKAHEFPNRIKNFAYNSWNRKSIQFLGVEETKQLDPNQLPILSTVTKAETEERNTFHHVFPKSFAHFMSINPQANLFASEFFPIDLIRKIILKNYNHPLNCLPIIDSSHALLHNPAFNQENYISWASLYDRERDNAMIVDKIKFQEISNFLGIPNWFYQYDNIFFTMNVLVMKNALKSHKKLSHIEKQEIYDIHNTFDILVRTQPELTAKTTRFLLQQEIIERSLVEM